MTISFFCFFIWFILIPEKVISFLIKKAMDQRCTDRQVWGPIQQNWSKIFTLPESSLLTLTITLWPIRPRSIITRLVIVTGTIWNRFFRYCLLSIEFQYAFNLMSLERISIILCRRIKIFDRGSPYTLSKIYSPQKSQKSSYPWPLINRFKILKSKSSIFEPNWFWNF